MAGRPKKYKAPQENVYRNLIQSTGEAPEAQEFYRFNLKTPIEYRDYLQEISWRNRTSITEYLNKLIAADMEAHPDWRDTLDILNK